LVLAGSINNNLETVVGRVGLEIGLGCPGVFSGVGDFLNNRVENLDVCGWPVEEEDGHSTRSCRVPLDFVGLANGDKLPEGWVDGRVTDGLRAHWLGVGGGQASEGRGDESGDLELHLEILLDENLLGEIACVKIIRSG